MDSGGPQFFPNATYVPFAPQTEQALAMTENRALAGNPLNQASQGQLLNTINGGMLNANPHLDSMFNNAAGAVTRAYNESALPGVNATFSLAGRTGSGAHINAVDSANDTLGRTLAGLSSSIYGGNYQQERDRQMAATALGPSMAMNDYNDINQLANVGQQVQTQAGNVLNDQMNRFNYYQNLPDQQLQNYVAAINGIPVTGGQTTTKAGSAGSPVAGAVGGGLLGYGLNSALGGSLGSALAGQGINTIGLTSALGGFGLPIAGALLGGLFS